MQPRRAVRPSSLEGSHPVSSQCLSCLHPVLSHPPARPRGRNPLVLAPRYAIGQPRCVVEQLLFEFLLVPSAAPLALPWYLPGGLSLGGSAAGPPTPPSRSFPDAPPPEVHSSSIFPRAGESGRDRRPTHRGSSRRPKIQDEDGGDGCLSRLVTARSAGKLAATMPNSGPCSGNQEPRRQPGSCDDQGPDEEYGARRRLTCMRAPPPDVERLELACIAAGAAPTPLWANPHPQHHYRYRRGR